jgi:DNA repair exonuclease SbcCD ATPase subunit
MFNALNTQTSTNGMIKIDSQKEDISQLNALHKNAIQALEAKIEELKNTLKQKDELLIENKSNTNKLQEIIDQNNKQITELNNKYLEADKLNNKITSEDQLPSQINEETNNFKKKIEQLKEEHNKETTKMRMQSEASIKDIKYIYEQEKLVMEERIEKMQNIIQTLQLQRESTNTQINMANSQIDYAAEIKHLSSNLEHFKKKHEEDLAAAIKQKEDAINKVNSLEHSLSKAKFIIKNVYSHDGASSFKAKLEKIKELVSHNEELITQNEYLQQENKKYKKIINQFKRQIHVYEHSEKKLKNKLFEKELVLGDDKLKELTNDKEYKYKKAPHNENYIESEKIIDELEDMVNCKKADYIDVPRTQLKSKANMNNGREHVYSRSISVSKY